MPCIDIETAKIEILKDVIERLEANRVTINTPHGEGYLAGINSCIKSVEIKIEGVEALLTLAWEELEAHMKMGRIERGEPV